MEDRKISRNLFLLLCVIILVFRGEAKKKSDKVKWLQELDNVKSFKKLLRAKTNILVMFADAENSAEKRFDIFGEAALKSKGTATLAWVDCSSKDGKKLCKKQKANPAPVELQHYKDGDFSETYERKFSVKSILAFLKDPKSDGPWEEEDSAKDVVHLDSEKQLNKILKKNKPTLVMFYAPWCGFCKRFKPVFAEAATELKGQVIMAGIDAEGNQDAVTIRQTYNISGFPKTIYFNEGKELFEYSGGQTKQDIIDWLEDPQEPKSKEPEQEWSDMENDVVHLTDATFDDYIVENKKVMVFFYAPWCGHCKNLKPEWDKAATILKEEEAIEKLTAIDATKYKEYGDRYQVTGYPTIIYFEDGEKKYDAGSAFKRTAEGIVEYIKDPKEPPPPEKQWHEVESDVVHLDDATFKSTLKKKKHALIMFYAPWCGHCKKAKPEYQNAATQFADDKKVAFAAVDCTLNREVCETFDVKGYPTFYYASYGKNAAKYQGGREEEDFVDFIKSAEEDHPSHDEEDSFWDNIPHSDLLHRLTKDTWSDFVRSHQRVLITIYSEDCPNCKDVRKHLAQCAKNATDQQIDVELAVIDGNKYSSDIYRLWTTDMGVPTLFWYEKGIKKFEYTKSRAASDLLDFVKNPVKPQVKKKFPDWSMEESADDIYHYKDAGFDRFAREQDDMMVLFYSPSCSNCFKLRTMYEKAATRLDIEKPSVTMAAVNLAEAPTIKEKYSINSYPHFAYFHNGKYKYQYHGNHEVNAIVTFMKKPKFLPKPDAEKEWSEMKTNVTILTKTSFHDFMKLHDHVIVMFYTKWCGHCKQFKSKYQKAADILKLKKPNAHLAAIDSDEAKMITQHYKITGFPTLLYFRNGKYLMKYPGMRETDDVVRFMFDPKERAKSRDKTSKVFEDGSDKVSDSKPRVVTSLSPSNIEDFLEENDETIVMFYAPWCGACKSAKGGFFQAAVEASEDLPDASFAIFNAVKYKDHVKDYHINGYPTFWYFEEGQKKFKYHGEFTKNAFLNFINDPRENPDPTSRDIEWMNEATYVEHPTQETFDRLINNNDDVMTFFYVNVCQVCLNGIKPEYVEAAEQLHQSASNAKLSAINAGREKSIAKKYNVNSFPTFLYFHNGKLRYRYHGSWNASSLVHFMNNPREDLARKVKPTSWQDMTSADYGYVIHLGNKTYDKFLQSHSQAVVLFHSLYYARCKVARQQFRLAADRLSNNADVGFGAVDCHRQPEQGLVCYHLTIRLYPSIKYYENGKFVSELTLNTSDDVISFLEGRLLLRETALKEKDEL